MPENAVYFRGARFIEAGQLYREAYNNNGRTAILVGADGLGGMLTVNLPNEPMVEGEVAIKSYTENDGVLEALVAQQIVSAPLRYADSGFVSIPICRLLVEIPPL